MRQWWEIENLRQGEAYLETFMASEKERFCCHQSPHAL